MPNIVKPPFRFWGFAFSLKGRITRGAFSCFVLPVQMALAGFNIAPVIFRVPHVGEPQYHTWIVTRLIVGITILVLLWPLYAATVKRLHDVGCNFVPALLHLLRPCIAIATAVVTVLYFHNGSRPPAWPTWLGYGQLAVLLIMSVVLSLWPGQRRSNRYGPPVIDRDSAAAECF